MNSMFAAGLFDNPLLIVVIVLVSALANWLSKRREGKLTNGHADRDEAKPAPGKPAGEFNLEETLRRLLGEEPPAPVAPPPPPLPCESQARMRPVRVRREERPHESVPPVPPGIPLSRAVARASVEVDAAGKESEQAARRFEHWNEEGRRIARVVRRRSGTRSAARWRDPRSARQAFVASLVFAPPKGLES